MVSCASTFGLWYSGYGKSFEFPPAARYLAESCVPWATASFLLGLSIMCRTRMPSQNIKNFPAIVAKITKGPAKGKVIEIWHRDEAKIGQKKITWCWERRSTRPSAPQDQQIRSAYIFMAICPKLGKAAALVMAWCDTFAMNQHLAKISPCRQGCTCRSDHGSGRIAYLQQPHHFSQHHHPIVAVALVQAQLCQKHLAIHMGKLALKLHIQIL
ncbi:hypothetical protein PanWU01x14_296170 [Parasponia andersonii]|uniref:Uncharacterized protein n=1 Tax=Parasponia andersonii TaxID=3476 RepID=A0A2P5AVP6_PARAD|nr:hypothetical protein PanWU01x14_296170 [Parasponia andersonii]